MLRKRKLSFESWMFQLSYGDLVNFLSCHNVHKFNVKFIITKNQNYNKDCEISHDGSWGSEPHSRTGRDRSYRGSPVTISKVGGVPNYTNLHCCM